MVLGAVVLSGGRGSRLGGVDKGALRLGGTTLLGRALEALAGLEVVVVGPVAPPGVTVVREEPPFSGPAAAAVAGLEALPATVDEVLLLAVDVPGLPAAVPLLAAAPLGQDGLVAVDEEGRNQWLLARYRRTALGDAAARLGDPAGASLRALLGGLDLARLALPPGLAADVDTVADAERQGVVLLPEREPGDEEAP